MTEGDLRAEVELGQADTALALVGRLMRTKRLPLAILEHQYPISALTKVIWQLRAVPPANHV